MMIKYACIVSYIKQIYNKISNYSIYTQISYIIHKHVFNYREI